MSDHLKAKVDAVNKANAFAADLHLILTEKFAPLVGKKILKNDGTLLAKYADLINYVVDDPRIGVYRNRSNYTLGWTVKTCEPVPPHTCVYHETTIYVGNLRGDVLVDLIPPAELRIDYTVKEILDRRAEFDAARKAFNAAQTALYPFGESDN